MNLFDRFKNWITSGGRSRKWLVGLGFVSVLITIYLMLASSMSVSANDPSLTSPLYYFGVLVKLAAVLALIMGSAILLRRWQTRQSFSKTVNHLQVLETVRLSPKQAIHLVRIGNQQILIGATDQNITLLTNIENNQEKEEIEDLIEAGPSTKEAAFNSAETSSLLNFNQLFKSLTEKQPSGMNESSSYDQENHV